MIFRYKYKYNELYNETGHFELFIKGERIMSEQELRWQNNSMILIFLKIKIESKKKKKKPEVISTNET